MKLITLLFSVMILSNIYAHPKEYRKINLVIEEQENNKWEIRKNSPFLSYSAEFVFKQADVNNGKVIRTGLLCPRYFYDVYDANDAFQARGITRFISLGFFSPDLIDIDVYDTSDVFIGSIVGKIIRRSRAKFIFYDTIGNTSAIAYLDAKTSDFLLVSPQDEMNVFAKVKGNTYGDVGIVEMEFISRNSNVDEKMLKIFGAFISDYHESFLEPPKEIHHHHHEYNFQNN